MTPKHPLKSSKNGRKHQTGNSFKKQPPPFWWEKAWIQVLCYWTENRHSPSEKERGKMPQRTLQEHLSSESLASLLGVDSQENLLLVLEHDVFAWPLLSSGFVSLIIPILQVGKPKPREDDAQTPTKSQWQSWIRSSQSQLRKYCSGRKYFVRWFVWHLLHATFRVSFWTYNMMSIQHLLSTEFFTYASPRLILGTNIWCSAFQWGRGVIPPNIK